MTDRPSITRAIAISLFWIVQSRRIQPSIRWFPTVQRKPHFGWNCWIWKSHPHLSSYGINLHRQELIFTGNSCKVLHVAVAMRLQKLPTVCPSVRITFCLEPNQPLLVSKTLSWEGGQHSNHQLEHIGVFSLQLQQKLVGGFNPIEKY